MKTSAVLSVTNNLMLTSDEVSVGGRYGARMQIWVLNRLSLGTWSGSHSPSSSLD